MGSETLFLLFVTYFPTNLVYPFTPRVTFILSDESSIPYYSTSNGYKNRQYFFKIQFGFLKKKTRKNAIVEYLDYQILVTQLKGPKGNER